MRKILLLPLFFFSLHSYSQFPDESDPHRGLYVDRFAKKLQGANVYDPNFSILGADQNRDGIFEKEDALLTYCAENHITTIELYDLEKIFGGTLTAWNENTHQYEILEKHLCRFMQKARDQYCITEIGAAGSTAYNFDSVAAFNERYPITEPYRLRHDQRTSVYFDSTLNIVERSIPVSDPSYKKAEVLKYMLRTADFNSCNPCGARFDNINSELEFWYSCASDLAGYESLMFAMNAIKQMYNTNHPAHPLRIESYLATLTYCSNLQDVVNFIDGCNNCAPCANCTNPHPRIVDRLLYSQLTGNGVYYSYYVQNLFEQAQTSDSTDYHTIQYAEGISSGGSVDYLGLWFELSPSYTIFTAEMYFYNGYRNNAGATFWSPESNNIQPGGTTWFSASHLVGHHDDPLIVQNNGPYCSYGNPVTVGFYYVGPEDPGMDYEFWVTNDSNGAVVYPQGGGMFTGTSTPFLPSDSIHPFHAAIDFSDTLLFPPLTITSGNYTSHINLYYDHHAGCAYSSDYPLLIEDKPAIEIIGDTVFCHGGYTFLKSSSGSSYQWYKDSLPVAGAVTPLLKVTEDGNYFCNVIGWGICNGQTDTVHVHVRQLPSFYVNANCNGNGTVTLKANLDAANPNSTNIHGDGGMLYQWNTGPVTDQITVTPGTSRTVYRLVATDPYSGCSKYKDVSVPATPLNSYTASISVTTPPSTPCSHDGVIYAIITPDPGSVVSYLWSTGETTRGLTNVAPGQYSFVASVWAGACSYYATMNVGTMPVDSPTVNAAITNVSCHNTNDGAIQLTLTGGHPPFHFFWREIPDDTVHNPNTQNQSNLYAGLYHVAIFDSSGCEFDKAFYVSSSNGLLTLATGAVNPVTQCANDHSGSATVIAGGGNSPYSYQWNDSALQITATAANLYAGSYSVTVTDANGCTLSQFVSIPSAVIELTANLVDSSVTSLNCDSSADGSLFVDICGGTLPYSLNGSWVYDSLAHLENLPAGDYALEVTDANGCMVADTFYIVSPAPVSANAVTNNTTCIGCPDGSISVSASGGTLPYIITWTPLVGSLNGTTIENLPAGNYYVCVSDSFNCITCFSDTVLDDPLFASEVAGEGLKIYPNPLQQTTTLLLKTVPENCVFAVFELTGRKVFELKPEKTETTFDRKNLSSGVYYFELSGNGVPLRKGKIILY